jgi:hypothetical protein
MFKKKQMRTIWILMVVLLLLFNISSVFADKPLALHIEVNTPIGPPTGSAEFFASGPAVDSGIVCAHGIVFETFNSWPEKEKPNKKIVDLGVEKHFVCDGGSNTFDITMGVTLNLETFFTGGHWRIVRGNGEYRKLTGNGEISGTPLGGGIVFDVYDGKVH